MHTGHLTRSQRIRWIIQRSWLTYRMINWKNKRKQLNYSQKEAAKQASWCRQTSSHGRRKKPSIHISTRTVQCLHTWEAPAWVPVVAKLIYNLFPVATLVIKCIFWWTGALPEQQEQNIGNKMLSKEVGADDSLWSLPTWPILWFCGFCQLHLFHRLSG